MEYIIKITGRFNEGGTVTTEIATKAKNPQAAILQVSGIQPCALDWWPISHTPDQIIAYRVLNPKQK